MFILRNLYSCLQNIGKKYPYLVLGLREVLVTISHMLGFDEVWLGDRDSNPDRQIQNLQSYHWTISQ